jgi:hypothetical protein
LRGWSLKYVDGLQVITDPERLGELLADMVDGLLDTEPEDKGKALLELSGDHLLREPLRRSAI